MWSASRTTTAAEIKEYKNLLVENLVAPSNLVVWVSNADGSNARQITFLEQFNCVSNFTPDGMQIIFSSNHEYKRGFPFNVYQTDLDGKGTEKISCDKGFECISDV